MPKPDWAIDVERDLETMHDSSITFDKFKKRCIYGVPNHLVGTDTKLYKPVKVSLGPYHHSQGDLQPMEKRKRDILLQFLKRSGTPLDSFIKALGDELENFMDAYDEMDPWWKKDMAKDTFLKMMLWDGCFILEVLNVYSKNVTYPVDDPIFGIHGSTFTLPLIKRDMLLLENQVPFLVIRILHAVTVGKVNAHLGEIPDELLYLLFAFFSTSTSPLSLEWSKISGKKCLHLLDVYREILLYEDVHILSKRKNKEGYFSPYVDTLNFPSASKLYDSGIRFKRSPTTHLKDISFKRSTLRFPPIIMADETISALANLMAFERLHAGAGNEVTSFVFFMKCLMNDEDDVTLLQDSGIIQNSLSNRYLVNSLRSLSKDVLLGPNNMLDKVYAKVSEKLRSRVKVTFNQWWVDLF